MNFFLIQPEVAGGLGEGTVLDATVWPPVVSKLHYRIDGWLGDCLLESFPCFIVTRVAANALAAAGITGFNLAAAEISASDQFRDVQPGVAIPEFCWLQVTGRAMSDDFGVSQAYVLVVSERALEVLKRYGVENALIEIFLQMN